METSFTPIASLFGGALIGTAAVLLMFSLGRVFGATGILLGAIVPSSRADWVWRIAVIAGMMTGPWLFRLFTGELPVVQLPVSALFTVVGGLIVGVGVTLGSGCTSGHGVCGLARVSQRSFVAVVVFMASTAVTVYIIRHVLGAA